ncbi:MAG: DNA-processing protein DprA, partial [Oscillospiraceae bacterium]|nr:DNA-processing protein DprA [Oscillospiraceae bacterium]
VRSSAASDVYNRKIYILTFDDGLYPERLKSIYNPPAVLFCRGDMGCLESDFSISVVGTRKPSDYSVRVTAALVRELCSFGITIVSGFAVGIDITANLSAARCGGKTIAVLGCGLDRDYPKENVQYRSEIEANGLFISEYYPLAGGTRASFPARNRILSGLSLGTIVSEAAVKSGALITANLALSQGKDVFALAPHDLFDKRYGGNVALIRDGAACLCGVKDILYEYYENYGHKIANASSAMAALFPDGNNSSAYKQASRIDPLAEDTKEYANENAETGIPAQEYDASTLEGDEAKVYGLLKEAGKPLLADELAEMCGMDISDMLMLLTDLELEGAVMSAAGQSYTAC